MLSQLKQSSNVSVWPRTHTTWMRSSSASPRRTATRPRPIPAEDLSAASRSVRTGSTSSPVCPTSGRTCCGRGRRRCRLVGVGDGGHPSGRSSPRDAGRDHLRDRRRIAPHGPASISNRSTRTTRAPLQESSECWPIAAVARHEHRRP